MLNDARYALRLLRRSPGFATAAVLTIALGIGATTAIFTLVEAVILQPLPIAEPDRVVTLHDQTGRGPLSRGFVFPQYLGVRDHGGAAFEAVAASSTRPLPVRVTLPDGTRMASAAFVSEGYFEVLGIRPAAGRVFALDEHQPGAEPVVIVSDAFWRGRLEGKPNAIGRLIRLGARAATIVGVTPRGFTGLVLGSPADIFVPLMAAPLVLPPANFYGDSVVTLDGGRYSPQSWIDVTARLRRGVTPAQAEAMLSAILPTRPGRAGQPAPTLRLVPTSEVALPQRTKVDTTRFTTLLATVVALVLLVGCANLAGLVLARNEDRRREMAVRLALGARRGALVRLFLVESLVLSICGGLVGLLVAAWMLTGMAAFVIPGGVNLESLQLGFTTRVLLFAAAAALFTTLLSGLMPALLGSRVDVLSGLKTSATALTAGRNLARGTLVASQIAISLILIVGAALFIRSLQVALATDVGVDAKRLAYANVSFWAARYDKAGIARFYDAILGRLKTMPNVEAVTIGNLPLASSSGSNRVFRVDGVERTLADTDQFYCGPDYFRTTGIHLSSGRAFAAEDGEGSPPVVIVNEAFARRAWPSENPLGRRVSFLPSGHDLEVVGIARDGKYRNLSEEGRLGLYLPWMQNQDWALFSGTVIVRTSAPTAAIAVLRREIREIDPSLPVERAATLESRIADLAMTQRIGASLLGWFSAVALALAVLGVYGLIAYAVARRTKEIGIRIALGAESRDVVRLMMRRSLTPVASGIAVGLSGAYVLAHLAAGFLFGVHPHDPMTLAAATMFLGAAAAIASYIPARRATRLDPVSALRAE